MVRVIVGVIDFVIVVVGLDGGVQEGRGVVDGVILEGMSLRKDCGTVVVLADGVGSIWFAGLDKKRVNASTNSKIESARAPNMTGSTNRGVDGGVVMIDIAGFSMVAVQERQESMG